MQISKKFVSAKKDRFNPCFSSSKPVSVFDVGVDIGSVSDTMIAAPFGVTVGAIVATPIVGVMDKNPASGICVGAGDVSVVGFGVDVFGEEGVVVVMIASFVCMGINIVGGVGVGVGVGVGADVGTGVGDAVGVGCGVGVGCNVGVTLGMVPAKSP